MPRVSIILTTHNEPRYLSQAIDSVRAQTFSDWELLIINDASPHTETASILSGYIDTRIRVLNHSENKGVAPSLNEALTLVMGEYIARIDDDDLWLSTEKLEKQVHFLDEHPSCVLLGSNIMVRDFESDKELYRTNYPTTDEAIRKSILNANPFAHSSVLIRSKILRLENGYDASLRRVEDYDLWLRLGKHGVFGNISEVMVAWRAPSPKQKNVVKTRLLDHLLKMRIMRRYAKDYPGFGAYYTIELLKTPFYWLASFL